MRDNRQSEVLQTKLLMETSIFYIIFVKTPGNLHESNLYHMEAHSVPNMEPKNLSPTARKIIEACDFVPSIRARWKEVDVPGWSGEPERTGSPRGGNFRLGS